MITDFIAVGVVALHEKTDYGHQCLLERCDNGYIIPLETDIKMIFDNEHDEEVFMASQHKTLLLLQQI